MSHSISRRTLLTLAAATAVGVAVFLHSRPSSADSLARVDLYDRTARQALPVYRYRGRSYVPGQPGNEYALRIRNCSGQRMLAVISIDGVNVITGETAAPGQSGYVIEAGDYVNVDGWRKSLQDSAAFYFTDPSDAYASRTGRPEDLGVIGVALFLEAVPERQEAVTFGDSAGKSSAERAAAPSASAADASLGTGHGRRVDDPARYTSFERSSDRPDEVIRIRYENRETLAAMGVLPRPLRRSPPREPDPFPGVPGFVPDP